MQQGDQRALEHQLWTAHGVKAEFATMQEIAEEGRVSEGKKELFVTRSGNEYEVAVAYYRAGYTPDDYHSETEWTVRSMIEKSAAIKCPNVGYHLAGTKAIQAALCKPGVLERYLEAHECEKLRQCFAEQYSLGDAETKEAAKKAIEAAKADGSGWVLKPQREGGGNNYYGEKLSTFLKDHENDSILNGYVLMQRIFPAAQNSIFCRMGEPTLAASVHEFGVFGAYFGEGNVAFINEYSGYLMRTKFAELDEGGITTGCAVFNSPSLV